MKLDEGLVEILNLFNTYGSTEYFGEKISKKSI